MQSLLKILTISLTCVAVEVVVRWGMLNTSTVLFDIGPKLCLWAASTLFVLSLTDRKMVINEIASQLTTFRGRLDVGELTDLINRTHLNPRFNVLFGVSLGAWVIDVVVSSKNLLLYNAIGSWNKEILLWFCVSLVIGVAATIVAVCSAKEAAKGEQHNE